MANTRTEILEMAEQMVRANGYNGFSFRNIASAIGIKSSSVHHHFSTKERLAEAVAERYMAAFFAALGEPLMENTGVRERLTHYAEVFQNSFNTAKAGCLCGVLSNEQALLPASVVQVVEEFADRNVVWLAQALTQHPSAAKKSAEIEAHAMSLYCALQGAMGVSTLKQDVDWVSRVANSTITSIMTQLASAS